MDLSYYWRCGEPTDLFSVEGYAHRIFAFYDVGLAVEFIERARGGEPLRDVFIALCRQALCDRRVKALPDNSPPWVFTNGRWRPVDMVQGSHGQ